MPGYISIQIGHNFFILIIYFTHLPQFPLHPLFSSFPPTSFSPLPPSTPFTSPFTKGKTFHGCQQSMTSQVETGPSSSQGWARHLKIRNRLKEPVHESGIGSGPTPRGATKHRVTQLPCRCKDPRSVPCWLPSCWFRVAKLPQAWVNSLWRFPSHYLDPHFLLI